MHAGTRMYIQQHTSDQSSSTYTFCCRTKAFRLAPRPHNVYVNGMDREGNLEGCQWHVKGNGSWEHPCSDMPAALTVFQHRNMGLADI